MPNRIGMNAMIISPRSGDDLLAYDSPSRISPYMLFPDFFWPSLPTVIGNTVNTASTYIPEIRKKTPEVPTNRMSTPAIAGPMMRVAFIDELISDMPFISLLLGMMSDTVACRLGMLNAISEPFISPESRTCHSSITPVKSSSPTTRVNTALPAWV